MALHRALSLVLPLPHCFPPSFDLAGEIFVDSSDQARLTTFFPILLTRIPRRASNSTQRNRICGQQFPLLSPLAFPRLCLTNLRRANVVLLLMLNILMSQLIRGCLVFNQPDAIVSSSVSRIRASALLSRYTCQPERINWSKIITKTEIRRELSLSYPFLFYYSVSLFPIGVGLPLNFISYALNFPANLHRP